MNSGRLSNVPSKPRYIWWQIFGIIATSTPYACSRRRAHSLRAPHHYIQSDLDRVTKMWKARFPGKTVKVARRDTGYTVTVTTTFHTDADGERP